MGKGVKTPRKRGLSSLLMEKPMKGIRQVEALMPPADAVTVRLWQMRLPSKSAHMAARLLGCSHHTVAAWLAGRSAPRRVDLRAMYGVLALLYGEDEAEAWRQEAKSIWAVKRLSASEGEADAVKGEGEVAGS